MTQTNEEQLDFLYRRYLDTDRYDELIHLVDEEQLNEPTVHAFKRKLKIKALVKSLLGEEEFLERIITANELFNEEYRSKDRFIEQARDQEYFDSVLFIHNYLIWGTELFSKEQHINREDQNLQRTLFFNDLQRHVRDIKSYGQIQTFSLPSVYRRRKKIIKDTINELCSKIQSRHFHKNPSLITSSTYLQLQEELEEFSYLTKQINIYYENSPSLQESEKEIYQSTLDKLERIDTTNYSTHHLLALEKAKGVLYTSTFLN
ncbi:MAG: hypothetical protein KC535_03755 [Nanoarchaeota archaeon]|nr:hypothetical protein [Nanoarchaeota archaeon]